jgi:hypothetical protein
VIQRGYKNVVNRHSSSKNFKGITYNVLSRSHSCSLKKREELIEPEYKNTEVITELIMEIDQSVDYEDIEEPIVSSIKTSHTPSNLPHKLTFKNAANFTGEEKCKCGKDKELPCCVRARNWIKIMFEKKGKCFPYKKYKAIYEVHFNTNPHSKC